MTDKFLRIENVRQTLKAKRGPFVALRDVNLAAARGECIAFIGYPGYGKSALLNLTARLTRPTADGLTLTEREIAGPGPDQAVVFQNHSLSSWPTYFDSVYLAVERVFGKSGAEVQSRDRTYVALALIGLSHTEQKYPHEISGGVKQCVGIAHVLSMEPKVLLMNEPFGALDVLTRAHLQDKLLRIVVATGSTVVTVTHDVDETILLADHIMMMTDEPVTVIGEVLTVDLSRPRDRMALAEDPTHHTYRTAVLDFLYRGQGHPVAGAARFAMGVVLLFYLDDPSPVPHPGRE